MKGMNPYAFIIFAVVFSFFQVSTVSADETKEIMFTNPITYAESDSDTELDSDTESDSSTESDIVTESGSESDIVTEPDSAVESDTVTEPGSDAESNIVSGPDSGAESDIVTEPDSGAAPSSDKEPDAETDKSGLVPQTYTSVNITYNDMLFEASALLINDIAFVDINAFYDGLYASVEETDEYYIYGYPYWHYTKINKHTNEVLLDEFKTELSQPIQYVDGVAMAPLRDLTILGGLTFSWNSDTASASVQTDKYRKANTLPFYIKMFKEERIMRIYELDDNYEYTLLLKEYPTAIGKGKSQTPLGKFQINYKELWHAWGNNVYSKYSCNYAPGLFIHTPLYRGKNDDNMIMNTYYDIQNNYTSGCLKTYTENCKWIFENCPEGTIIEIFE